MQKLDIEFYTLDGEKLNLGGIQEVVFHEELKDEPECQTRTVDQRRVRKPDGTWSEWETEPVGAHGILSDLEDAWYDMLVERQFHADIMDEFMLLYQEDSEHCWSEFNILRYYTDKQNHMHHLSLANFQSAKRVKKYRIKKIKPIHVPIYRRALYANKLWKNNSK